MRMWPPHKFILMLRWVLISPYDIAVCSLLACVPAGIGAWVISGPKMWFKVGRRNSFRDELGLSRAVIIFGGVMALQACQDDRSAREGVRDRRRVGWGSRWRSSSGLAGRGWSLWRGFFPASI